MNFQVIVGFWKWKVMEVGIRLLCWKSFYGFLIFLFWKKCKEKLNRLMSTNDVFNVEIILIIISSSSNQITIKKLMKPNHTRVLVQSDSVQSDSVQSEGAFRKHQTSWKCKKDQEEKFGVQRWRGFSEERKTLKTRSKSNIYLRGKEK